MKIAQNSKHLLIIVLIIFGLLILTNVDINAQNSIKLGTFVPGEITATPVPTITNPVPAVPKKKSHPTHPPDPSPTPDDGMCHFSYPANDRQYLEFGKMSVAEYKGWLNVHGAGPTPTQDQWAYAESQIYEFIDQVSGDLYNRSFLYGKAVARLSMTQGFGLDKKQELHATLEPLSCEERGGKVSQYLESPLFFYPEKNISLTLKLPSTITTSINPKYYSKEGEYHIFSFSADRQSHLKFADGYLLPYISYDNPEATYSKESNSGRILYYLSLYYDLYELAQDVGLTPAETEVFVPYFLKRLPKANYYTVSLIEDEVSRQIMPWIISPTPDREIRLLFLFKPYIGYPAITYQNLNKIKRAGFTVVDFAGIIHY